MSTNHSSTVTTKKAVRMPKESFDNASSKSFFDADRNLISRTSITRDNGRRYFDADLNKTLITFTNPEYTDQDLEWFEEAWSDSIAGTAIDKKVEFTIGAGVRPTFELIDDSNMDDAQKARELDKFNDQLEELHTIDEAVKFDTRLKDALRLTKVFGRCLMAFDGLKAKDIPSTIKLIHPRDTGRVFVDQDTWEIEKVRSQFPPNDFAPDEMIYMVNMADSPKRRNKWFGVSEMERIVGGARAWRRIVEFDMPEAATSAWAKYGMFLVKKMGRTDADAQTDMNELLDSLKPGAFSAVSVDAMDEIEYKPVDLEPKLKEMVELASFYERIIIGNTAVPSALLGREEDQNRACYSSDTQTLTEHGWKYYWEIEDGERIASVNPDTGATEFHVPDEKAVYDYEGQMVHILNKNHDIMVTPDHDMWTSNYHNPRHARFEKVKADQLVNRREINFASVKPVKRHELLHYELESVNYNRGGTAQIQITKVDAFTWCEFLGYYLSEGHKAATNTRNPYHVSLSQKQGSNADKIQDCLNRLPFNFNSYTDNDGIIRWQIDSKQLHTNLQGTGGLHNTKRIPRDIMEKAGPKQLQQLLDALILGDGHTSKQGTMIYYTTSHGLAEDVQELATILGYTASKRLHYKTSGNRKTAYRVFISDPIYHRISKDSITYEPYKGKVYCFGVKNHLFITRRNNGIPTIQGNTLIGKIRFFIEGPIQADRQWLSDIISEQWYKRNLIKLGHKDLLEKVRVKAEFEPIFMEAWDDQVESVQKLKEIFPNIPDEVLIDLLNLEEKKTEILSSTRKELNAKRRTEAEKKVALNRILAYLNEQSKR